MMEDGVIGVNGVSGGCPCESAAAELSIISGALITSKRDGLLVAAFFPSAVVGSATSGVTGGAGRARLTLLKGGGSSFNVDIASSYILYWNTKTNNVKVNVLRKLETTTHQSKTRKQ